MTGSACPPQSSPVGTARKARLCPPYAQTANWSSIRNGREQEEQQQEAPMDLINVDYSTKIPNNVGLTEDRRILRALEGWHPGYLDWWRDMGPEGFQEALVYLRTAVSVDSKGWAKFDYVKMPEYRWGILLAPQEENR